MNQKILNSSMYVLVVMLFIIINYGNVCLTQFRLVNLLDIFNSIFL